MSSQADASGRVPVTALGLNRLPVRKVQRLPDPVNDIPITAGPVRIKTVGVQGLSEFTVHSGDQAGIAQPREQHPQDLQKTVETPFQNLGYPIQRPNISWSKSEADRRGNDFLLSIHQSQPEYERHRNSDQALAIIRKYIDLGMDVETIKETVAPVPRSEAASANTDFYGSGMIWQEWILLFDTTPRFFFFAPTFLQNRISYLHGHMEVLLRAPSMALATGSEKSLIVALEGVTWTDYVLRFRAHYRRFRLRVAEYQFHHAPIQDPAQPPRAPSIPVEKRRMPEPGQEISAEATVSSARKKARVQPRWSLRAMQFLMDTYKTRANYFPDYAREGPSHELESNCTPFQVDITLCNVPISVEEILTYFPLHTEWRMVGARLHAHGWTAQRILEYIFWSRQLKDEQTLVRSKLQYHLKCGMNFYNAKTDLLVSAMPFNMDKTKGRGNNMYENNHDYYLVDLAEGVAEHPQDRGKQALTHAILHAVANGHAKTKLSQVRDYIKANIPFLIPEEDFNCRKEDITARERCDTLGETTRYYRSIVMSKQPA